MSVLVALVVGALTFGASLVVLTTQRRVALHRRLGHFVGGTTARASRTHRLQASGLAAVVERALERVGLLKRVRLALDRAAVDTSPGAAGSVVLLVGVALAVLALVVSGPGAALGALVGTPAVAVLALVVLGRRREQAFENQLPEILDTLTASLRAGHSFHHALQHLADDIAEPARREFRRVVAEVQLGRSLEAALADLGERMGSEDFLFVLDAINVQRQVGGSMAELFELVAQTVRARTQFRRNLRAITGMVRASAKILTALPVVAGLLLTLVNHEYMAPLFSTRAGIVMICITTVMMLIGGSLLKKIGTVNP